MGDKTGIAWTDATINPIRARNKETGKLGWHCTPHSPGCTHCYSEVLNKRLGTGLPFKPGHRKDVELFLDEKMLMLPLKWRRPRKIFVCSMTDLFGEFVPDEWIDRIFAVMALCPQHTFQILTKRSKRMREYVRQMHDRWLLIERAAEDLGYKPRELDAFDFLAHKHFLPNVWLGISAEDQQRAEERIPDLLATPAAIRFVSAEPLLGPIKFRNMPIHDVHEAIGAPPEHDRFDALHPNQIRRLDWIICGGESGRDFRPMQMAWAEDIMRQCQAGGTAYFFKQASAARPGQRGLAGDELWASKEFPA